MHYKMVHGIVNNKMNALKSFFYLPIRDKLRDEVLIRLFIVIFL